MRSGLTSASSTKWLRKNTKTHLNFSLYHFHHPVRSAVSKGYPTCKGTKFGAHTDVVNLPVATQRIEAGSHVHSLPVVFSVCVLRSVIYCFCNCVLLVLKKKL